MRYEIGKKTAFEKFARFVRRNISNKLGVKMMDWNYYRQEASL